MKKRHTYLIQLTYQIIQNNFKNGKRITQRFLGEKYEFLYTTNIL